MRSGPDLVRVVLGDSNLNVDLPFGVQTLSIREIHLHEGYSPSSKFHSNDVGMISLPPSLLIMFKFCDTV